MKIKNGTEPQIMGRNRYHFKIADFEFPILLNCPETRFYMGSAVRKAPEAGRGAESCSERPIEVSPEMMEQARKEIPAAFPDSYVEYKALIALTSKRLLLHGAVIFHAVAFSLNGRAWLLTGPSGVGKSTQYLNWQRLFPGEIRMISGDMPVLKSDPPPGSGGSGGTAEGTVSRAITVFPSPWNGKERISGDTAAPLGGIVVLEQGRGNIFRQITAAEAFPLLFRQFVGMADTEKEARSLFAMMDRVLREVPVYRFVNTGDDESTELLRERITV